MTFFRGQDGSATWATNAVANVNEWRMRATAGMIEGTAMQDKSRKRLPGLVTFAGAMQFRLNLADAAQLAILQSVISATPATASGALVLISHSATPNMRFSGNALFSNIETTQPLEGVVQCSADFESDGDWTVTYGA